MVLMGDTFTVLAENPSWKISKNDVKYLLDVFVDDIKEPIVFDKIIFGKQFKGFHAVSFDRCIVAEELA